MTNFIVSSIPNVPHKDESTHAFFYSGAYETITGKTMKNGGNVKRYICIENKGRTVYKQYSALNGLSKGQIALDYESQCNLGVNIGDSVKVCSTSKLCYYWHTCDSIARLSLILAIVSILLSVVIDILH